MKRTNMGQCFCFNMDGYEKQRCAPSRIQAQSESVDGVSFWIQKQKKTRFYWNQVEVHWFRAPLLSPGHLVLHLDEEAVDAPESLAYQGKPQWRLWRGTLTVCCFSLKYPMFKHTFFNMGTCWMNTSRTNPLLPLPHLLSWGVLGY